MVLFMRTSDFVLAQATCLVMVKRVSYQRFARVSKPHQIDATEGIPCTGKHRPA
jgi:hypothetical protein